MRTVLGRSKASARRDLLLKGPLLDRNPPRNESEAELEPRPGEDILDFVLRESERNLRRIDKSAAELSALRKATREKLEEVVFYCDQASKAWDETAARIQAIRAQDSSK